MPRNDENIVKKEGLVMEALPGDLFKIRLDDASEALGYLSGRMRMHRIRVLPGDRVDMEFSLYDNKRGRITRRL
ncbi:MAG: translation initiation factor IF-1 [bacterium]|nr:translation initiation factor IF-1 [bacterium]